METKATSRFSDSAILLAAQYACDSKKCFGPSRKAAQSDVNAIKRLLEGKRSGFVKSWDDAALDFLNGKTTLRSLDEYATAAAALDTSVASQGQMSAEEMRHCLRALAVAAARSGVSLQTLAQHDYEVLATSKG